MVINTLNPQFSSSSSQAEILNLSSDFSDKFEKSKNKLIYATVFSITVGLYTLSEQSNFLGLKLNGLSDRRLEWMAWSAAVFFFVNTLFRYFDERRTAEKYKNEVAKLGNEVGTILQRIRDSFYEMDRKLSNNGRFEEDLKRMKRQVERFEKSLEKFLDKKQLRKVFAEFQFSLDSIEKEVASLNSRNNDTLFLVRDFPRRIDRFEKKVSPVRKYKNIGGIRFLIFDFVLPVSLFVFATLIHIFPETKELILEAIPLTNKT